jgi:rhodanese-related sulfurtransferase
MLQRVPCLFKNTTQTSSFFSKSSVLSTKRFHQGKMTPPIITKAATPSSSSSDAEARKPGVASNAEMRAFLEQNQDASKKIVIVDARNPDFSVEPSDELYGSTRGKFPIADCGTEKRPNALNAPFDRTKKALSGSNVDILQTFEKDRAIITHCGGGGRGQKSKEWLEKEGFTNVVNGGGPQVTELWDMFGHL